MRSKSANLKGDTADILYKAEAICFKISIEKNHRTFLALAEPCPYIFREFYRLELQ